MGTLEEEGTLPVVIKVASPKFESSGVGFDIGPLVSNNDGTLAP